MPGGKNGQQASTYSSKAYCTRTKVVSLVRKAENRGDLQLTLDDLPGFDHRAS